MAMLNSQRVIVGCKPTKPKMHGGSMAAPQTWEHEAEADECPRPLRPFRPVLGCLGRGKISENRRVFIGKSSMNGLLMEK